MQQPDQTGLECRTSNHQLHESDVILNLDPLKTVDYHLLSKLITPVNPVCHAHVCPLIGLLPQETNQKCVSIIINFLRHNDSSVVCREMSLFLVYSKILRG